MIRFDIPKGKNETAMRRHDEHGAEGMSYDTMQAGEEMNRLIANKVMGWSKGHDDDCYMDGIEEVWTDYDPVYAGRTFNPSTNIAHAWEVVEKLHIGVLPIGDGLWRAGFSDPKSFVNWWEQAEYGACETMAEADTAPLAICRAALGAVGK